MKMCINHLAFLIKQQWWKILWIYIILIGFNMSMKEIIYDVKSVFNEMALFRWILGCFMIFIFSQIIQKQLYDTWLRFKLLPGNKFSLVFADILFLCIVFSVWYIIFISEYRLNLYSIYDFNNVIERQPFMSLFYPNSISNVLRGILHIVCLASLDEYCVLLYQRKLKTCNVISEILWFLLVFSVVVFLPIYFVILIYVALIIYYLKKGKYRWNHMEIGG